MSESTENFGQFSPTISAKEYLIHSALFLVTFVSAMLAGVQWLNRNPLELSNIWSGLTYAILIMLMLASHEFGHYTAARIHKVNASLPYFIPFPSFLVFFLSPFGTFGAVIRLRSAVRSRKVIFDIGSAGPIAGFIVSLAILIIGFRTLPSIEYLYRIHPEYAQMAAIPKAGLAFGKSIVFSLVAAIFAPQGAFVPPMNEIYHYPFLCVGWFGLFVTSLNLIPIAQLDGGHISFAMFGRRYHLIAQVALVALVIFGTAGFLPILGVPLELGWPGWLFWALILVVFLRSPRFNRAPVEDETPLDRMRMIVGWICFLIFITSVSLTPFTFD